MKYLLPLAMKRYIGKMKVKDPLSILMGLDVGRTFNGVALSDKSLQIAKVSFTVSILEQSYKTLILDVPLINENEENDHGNTRFFKAMRNIMQQKHVKGIIVGYPLDDYGKEMSHCKFIRKFIAKLHKYSAPYIPVTLVNENSTTKSAKRIIVDVQQLSHPENPDMIFRKRMYDKVAAKIILQQYLDYINHDKELLAIDVQSLLKMQQR
eukprot:TRINITY_DN125273_c0_g1_i1.p1 TRINITY_DN125273_c0_g1~~TRINITY_DN125273_c0_g1_i1.p1  ORF type:complete len:209 (-),score=14.58 TRINITY_DN125273_c0_g1_i1:60-686(-)